MISDPVPDDAIRTLTILAKFEARDGDVAKARRLMRVVAILGGSPMSVDESKSKLGLELARQRKVLVRPRNSNRPRRKNPLSGLPKLSAEDEAWRKKAIESGQYGEQAPVEEKPYCGLVRM